MLLMNLCVSYSVVFRNVLAQCSNYYTAVLLCCRDRMMLVTFDCVSVMRDRVLSFEVQASDK